MTPRKILSSAFLNTVLQKLQEQRKATRMPHESLPPFATRRSAVTKLQQKSKKNLHRFRINFKDAIYLSECIGRVALRPFIGEKVNTKRN